MLGKNALNVCVIANLHFYLFWGFNHKNGVGIVYPVKHNQTIRGTELPQSSHEEKNWYRQSIGKFKRVKQWNSIWLRF